MVSATFLTGAFVAFGFKAVIASPCRPSSQTTLSSGTSVSLTTSSKILLVPTSTTEEIYQSETVTSLLSAYSSILETGTDSTGLPNTAESSATETGTTTAVNSEESPKFTTTTTSETTPVSFSGTVTSVETGATTAAMSDESTAITTTVTSETTTWFISETIATIESEVTTLATTEITDEPTTASISQTTTEETPASTTESTLPPVPTFELVARSESVGDIVMHTNGRQVLVSTDPFPSSWSSSITYDEGTEYLVVNGVPLCIMYGSSGRLASLGSCSTGVDGQYRHLTCQPPSPDGLVCTIRAMMCDNSGCSDLGYTWDHWYLLGWGDGVWGLVIGADDLTTERDAPNEGLEPVGMDIRASFS